jgi:hypothetical protein
MSLRTADDPLVSAERVLRGVNYLVYSLAALLAVSLLLVGTVAVIAELKGTWHWMIHLESTISYMGVFVGWQVTALVPLIGLKFGLRWWVDE